MIKKSIAALLTASCLCVGMLGLAACNKEPEQTPPPKPPVGKTLSTGKNTVTLTDTTATSGDKYSFTAPETGTYAFVVLGSGSSVKVSDNVVTSYTATLNKDAKLELTCGSASGSAVTYSLLVGAVSVSLSTTQATNLTVPSTGNYTFATVNVAEAGDYEFAFENGTNAMATYNLIYDCEETTADERLGAVLSLPEGESVVAITSNLQNANNATVDLSVSPYEENVNALKLGANAIALDENSLMFGVDYTFVASQTAKYVFTVDRADTDILVTFDNDESIGYLSGEFVADTYEIILARGQELTVNCASNKATGTHNYNLQIAQEEADIDNVLKLEEDSLVLVNDKTATVTITAPKVGNYVIIISGAVENDTITLQVEGGEPISKTALLGWGSGKYEASFNVALTTANTSITITLTQSVGLLYAYVHEAYN